MITNMRHKLVLSLYSTVGLAGLAVLAFGVLGFVTTGLFALAAASTMAVGVDGALPLGTILLFPLTYLLVAAVGAAIGGYALRVWYARRRAGPAPDSASVGKTPIGRIVGVVIFGFFACYAGYTLFYMIGMYSRDGLLEAFGTTVDARITSIAPLPEIHEDLVSVRYIFTTSGGQVVNDARNQWVWQMTELKKTGTIPVTYIASWPELRNGAHTFDLQDALSALGQYIAIFCVGVWGAGKNLGLWASGKQEGAIEDMRAPAIMEPPVLLQSSAAVPRLTASRKTFGRRGA